MNEFLILKRLLSVRIAHRSAWRGRVRCEHHHHLQTPDHHEQSFLYSPCSYTTMVYTPYFLNQECDWVSGHFPICDLANKGANEQKKIHFPFLFGKNKTFEMGSICVSVCKIKCRGISPIPWMKPRSPAFCSLTLTHASSISSNPSSPGTLDLYPEPSLLPHLYPVFFTVFFLFQVNIKFPDS